jgi:hypothetical protein
LAADHHHGMVPAAMVVSSYYTAHAGMDHSRALTPPPATESRRPRDMTQRTRSLRR